MPILALFALLLALFFFWQAGKQRQAAGLPTGRVIYADTNAWKRVDKPLYDPLIRLTGKPDYLIEQNGELIPVEVKSTRVDTAPYDSHLYQLAAYCLLVERQYGKRPAYGVLRYANQSFAVDYTPEIETGLLSLLDEMRAHDVRKGVARSHDAPQRCARCGFRAICDQRL